LRGVNRSTRDRSSLPQKVLVISQAALSLVLIAGAILFTRSLNNLEHQNFGIVTANRSVVHIDPAGAGYTADRLPALYRQIQDRFSSLPGVATIGWLSTALWKGRTGGMVQQTPRRNPHAAPMGPRESELSQSIGVAIIADLCIPTGHENAARAVKSSC
jgi:hypothetical protein